MEFTERDILVNCNPITMRRAKEIVQKNKIKSVKVERIEDSSSQIYLVSAMVKGSNGENYATEVKITPSSRRKIQNSNCECMAFSEYSGLCKHCVALLYWFLENGEETEILQPETPKASLGKVGTPAEKNAAVPAQQSSREIKLLMQRYGMDGTGLWASDLDHFVSVEASLTSGNMGALLEITVGSKRMYVVKDIIAFAKAVYNKESFMYGKGLSFVHERSAFDKNSRELVDLVVDMIRFRFRNFAVSAYNSVSRSIELNPYELERLLKIYEGRSITVDRAIRQVRIGNPSLSLKIDKVPGDRFQLHMNQFFIFNGVTGDIIMTEDEIYLCSSDFTSSVDPMLRMMAEERKYLSGWQGSKPKYLNEKDCRAFCGNVLTRIIPYVGVESPQMKLEEYMPGKGEAKIYLDLYKKDRVSARLEIYYGEHCFNLLDLQADGDYHDLVKEKNIVGIARRYFADSIKLGEDIHLITDGTIDSMYHLLKEGLEDLGREADLFVSDRLKRMKIVEPPRVSVGVSIESGILEMNVSMEEFNQEELAEILAAYRERREFFRLKDGNFLPLADNSLSVLAELSTGLDLNLKEWNEKSISLPVYRAAYLDAVIREQRDKIESERNESFKQMIRSIREPEESDFEIPEGLNGKLRGYQKTGYRFLMALSSYGLGGILADDMGLGKTVQVISMLLKMRKKSLIVCPASLVYNWESELGRFAPDLEVVVVTGVSEERKARIASFRDGHAVVLVTSYDLLKRDIDIYEDIQFEYHIIDEAQYIKNAGTQASQAVKKIKSVCRFALTGTPIENRLSELWSIFDFVMPGYLYQYRRFREEVELPVVQSQDEKALRLLQRMIRPFILRRMKKDVLLELPDKIENVIYSRMTDKQEKLYKARALMLQKELTEKSDNDFQKDRMRVLAELIRLRQICCSPSLCYDDYDGGSGKLETFLDLAGSAVEGGHRILVFSQFTQMLAILEQELKKQNIRVLMLTGKDSKEKRRTMIDAFQDEQADIFLISLKAGGTGLNLTAADMVIHYDPWWNVAAQNQATDRAYRIGQKSKVTVMRMVTKGTVEEKILELQEKKRELVSQVLADGGFTDQVISKKELLDILT